MRRRRAHLYIAWLLVAAEMLIAVIEIWSALQSGQVELDTIFGETIFTFSGILFSAVGAFIVTRQPRNLIGWLMMAPGLLAFSALATIPPPSSPSLLEYVGLYFSGVSWVLIVYPVSLLIALFPTGRSVNARWRWHTWLATGMPAFFLAYVAFSTVWSDSEAKPPWSIANPIGFITADPFASDTFVAFWTVGLALVVGAATVAMVTRYRKAHYVERQQIKWLLYAVSIFTVGFITEALISGSNTNQTLHRVAGLGFSLGMLFIPVAIAIALLRYKAFDIDLVIRRTLSYTAVSILLVAVYLGSVVAIQYVVGNTFELDSAVSVAVSTLIVAALFNPLRRSIQAWVDRRFNRARYDAERILGEFGDHLKDVVDVDQIAADSVTVVAQTMHPAAIGIWVSHTKEPRERNE